MFIVGAFFIIWDVLFTRYGIWGFNDTYITGIRIINLPTEDSMYLLLLLLGITTIYEHLEFRKRALSGG